MSIHPSTNKEVLKCLTPVSEMCFHVAEALYIWTRYGLDIEVILMS